MANMMIEATAFLVAAAAVGFMTAWVTSRARWRRPEAQWTSRLQAGHRGTPDSCERIDPRWGASSVDSSAPRNLSAAFAGEETATDPRRARIAAVLRTPEYSYPLELVVEGPGLAARLRALGLRSTFDLLSKCGSTLDADSLSAGTGIPTRDLRRWASLADLLRLEEVRTAEAHLLLGAGIDSSQALAAEDAGRVAARMARAAAETATHAPTASAVAAWIVNARSLPPRLVD